MDGRRPAALTRLDPAGCGMARGAPARAGLARTRCTAARRHARRRRARRACAARGVQHGRCREHGPAACAPTGRAGGVSSIPLSRVRMTSCNLSRPPSRAINVAWMRAVSWFRKRRAERRRGNRGRGGWSCDAFLCALTCGSSPVGLDRRPPARSRLWRKGVRGPGVRRHRRAVVDGDTTSYHR